MLQATLSLLLTGCPQAEFLLPFTHAAHLHCREGLKSRKKGTCALAMQALMRS